MFAVSPVIELVNEPVPNPSEVLLPLIVGSAEVLQQTPRADTGEPPSLVTLPPPSAVVADEGDGFAVDTDAIRGVVVNEISCP